MITQRHAYITGIGGQDGRYLADLLIDRGYRITGLSRDAGRAVPRPGIATERWSMVDDEPLHALLARDRPDEFYNFAAYSSGAGMFDDPVAIAEVNGVAVARILEAIRAASPATRFCQASSAEIFGRASGSPQTEASPPDPRSPYGSAKLFAQNMIRVYRERYRTFACAAILFNHESPLRGEAFVTRKITRAAAAISLGLADHVVLGNLAARRDWGFAGDYTEAMWLMLQREVPEDFVIATGFTHSVEDFCRIAFERVGLDYRDHVRTGDEPSRVPEPLQLVGDPHRAARDLGWTATMKLEQLVALMIDADLALLRETQGDKDR